MPKVYLTEAQKEKDRLSRNIELVQGKRSNAEMGKIIGTTGQTFGNRKRNPESFTLSEVRLLCNKFRIDRSDFLTKDLALTGVNEQ